MADVGTGGLEVDVSLTFALRSFCRTTSRTRSEARPDSPAPFSPMRLGDWLALAAEAGIAVVPALRLGDIAALDLASLSGDSEDPVSADGRAAVERLALSLRDAPAAGILRWDIGCLETTLAAVRAGRRPVGTERGYSVFRGRTRPCFRDARLAREALLWPQPRVAAWLRPWIEPRKIAGDARPCPETWRIYLGAGGVAAASLADPEASMPPDRLGASGCGAALDVARRLFDRLRRDGLLPRPQDGEVRPDGILCTLDVLIDEAGQPLLLDGGPAPVDDRSRPAWRCCFPPGAMLAGLAIGDGRIVPLPPPDNGAAVAA